MTVCYSPSVPGLGDVVIVVVGVIVITLLGMRCAVFYNSQDPAEAVLHRAFRFGYSATPTRSRSADTLRSGFVGLVGCDANAAPSRLR